MTTIIPAQPGWRLVEVFDNDEVGVEKQPEVMIQHVIAWKYDDEGGVEPICVHDDSHENFVEKAFIDPSDVVRDLDGQRFGSADSFADRAMISWRLIDREAA